MKYTYIPSGIKGKFVKIVWIATGRGKLLGLLEEEGLSFILVDRLFLVSPTLKARYI